MKNEIIGYGFGLLFGFLVASITNETMAGLVGLILGFIVVYIVYPEISEEKVLFCEQCKILTFSTSDKELRTNANIHTIANPDHVTYIGEKIELSDNKT